MPGIMSFLCCECSPEARRKISRYGIIVSRSRRIQNGRRDWIEEIIDKGSTKHRRDLCITSDAQSAVVCHRGSDGKGYALNKCAGKEKTLTGFRRNFKHRTTRRWTRLGTGRQGECVMKRMPLAAAFSGRVSFVVILSFVRKSSILSV
jgi:hypothetical protein